MPAGQSQRTLNEVTGFAVLELRSYVVQFHLHRDRHIPNRTDHYNTCGYLRAVSNVSIRPILGRMRTRHTVLDVELVIVSEDFNGFGADAGHGR
ncbi:hypothetical protein BH11PSE9_BH11PSE9_33640 [soil metagenome]